MRGRRLIGVGGLAGALIALGLVAALHLRVARPHPGISRPASPSRPAPPRGAAGAGEASLTVGQVETAFVASYGRFLDGGPASTLARASLTARAEARADGRIPGSFRDGPLALASLTGRAGPDSAQATVVLANREERYPFGVTLLREAHGWVISTLDPPDLSMDRRLRPAGAARAPEALSAATRRFAAAYARFRAGRGPLPAAAPSALAAIRAGSDSLAGIALGHGAPRLARLQFGPVSDGEVAVTATVAFGRVRERFSLLMQQQAPRGAWRCTAFL